MSQKDRDWSVGVWGVRMCVHVHVCMHVRVHVCVRQRQTEACSPWSGACLLPSL